MLLSNLGMVASALFSSNSLAKKKGRAAAARAEAECEPATPVPDEEVEGLLPVSSERTVSTRRRGARFEKKRQRDESDVVEVGGWSPVSDDEDLAPRALRRDLEAQLEDDDEVRKTLTQDQRNAIVFGFYSNAQQKLADAGRSRFAKDEQAAVLEDMQRATGESTMTWSASQQRVRRIRKKKTVTRTRGSGRPSTFTPEIEECAATVARRYGGDVSRSQMFEEVSVIIGKARMCSRTVFFDHLNSSTWKRRRIRYRPRLTDLHRQQRVAFAQHCLEMDAETESRIVFLDEKRFEVTTQGTLTLPAEDSTPQRYVQSKTNPVFVMVLVGILKPRDGFDGIAANHAFVERVAAQRASSEKGTIELKAINVSGATYLDAWKETMFPALKALIDDQSIPTPTAAKPLLFQDDNAKPHRAKIGGVVVSQLISEMGLRDFEIHIRPLDPAQPAQSPDTNPLDTFFFRMLNIRFRRLRALSRVQAAAAGLRVTVAEADDDDGEPEVLEEEVLEDGDDDGGEEVIVRRRGVPLRCGPDGVTKSGKARIAKCRGCLKVVHESDMNATECSLRHGWWHNGCAQALIGRAGYERATDPATVDEDDPWVCPQCAHHLCRNDDRHKDRCVMCGKPSMRNGAENMGSDMISCDGHFGGLFHKTCARYVEAAEILDGSDNWFCLACDLVLENDDGERDWDVVDAVDECPCHENSVQGMQAAIRQALGDLSPQAVARGFESRRAFFQKIVDAEGGNDFDQHYRGERKRKEKEAAKKRKGKV